MTTDSRQCDVLVIGGGPAGTTAATLLARRGWHTVLLERERHPRFHIGESLLPMNLPLLHRLGVLDQVAAIGVHKPAADFTGPDCAAHRTFPFANALGASPDHAYQVTRSEFDAVLFANCRAAGASALEQHRVRRVDLKPRGLHEVQVQQADGSLVQWHCRYVLDASGQDTVLARQHAWRRRDRRHSAAAFYAHFRGVIARPGDAAGNISIYWFEHGWIWMIPLQDGVTSVGAVCRSDVLKNRGEVLEDFFRSLLQACPAATPRMSEARQVTPVRTAANYSYRASRQTGPGFALVGDAFTFIDPVFSSGVYLAMSSAEAVVPAVDSWLRGRRLRYRLATLLFRRRIARGVRTFRWFIYRFNSPAMRWLFENPSNVFNLERAVVSLLAGDVYDRPSLHVRLVVFRILYHVVGMVQRHFPELLSHESIREFTLSGRRGVE